MRYVIVENGIVVNAIVADPSFVSEFYPNAILAADDVYPGMLYSEATGEFISATADGVVVDPNAGVTDV